VALKVGTLYAEMQLDKSHFDKGLTDSETSSRGWSSRIGGIFKNAGKLIAAGLLVGTVAIGGIVAVTANAASDLNETMSKVGVVFGENADAIKAWSQGSAQSMGISRQQALETAGTFGNLFVAMKIGGKPATEMSENLVQLASDLASFNNLDPTDVLESLRAGLVGEIEPMRKFGVNITQAAIEAKAMELGLWDGKDAIDAAAKAQASYALIMEQTTTAQGDFGRTSSGMANQQRITAATFQDTMAAVGQAFTPIIEQILPMVTAALVSFGAWVTANMPQIKATMADVMTNIGAAIDWLSINVLPKLVDIFTWFVENVLPRLVVAADWIAKNVLPALAAAFQWIGDNVLPALAAIFSWLVTDVIPPLVVILDWITTNVIPPLVAAFKFVADIVQKNWPLIKTTIDVAAKAIQTIISTMVTLVQTQFTALQTAVGVVLTVFDGLKTGIGIAWDGITSIIKGSINLIIDALNVFIDAIDAVQVHIPAIGVGPISTPAFDWNGVGLSRIPRLSQGTSDWPGGLAYMNEEGPEVVNLPRHAQVFPADQTAAMLRGGDTWQVFGVTADDVERAIYRARRREALGMG
jgi:phage-related protein